MRDAEDPYLGSYDGDEEALLFTEWIHETAAEEYAPPPTRIARASLASPRGAARPRRRGSKS